MPLEIKNKDGRYVRGPPGGALLLCTEVVHCWDLQHIKFYLPFVDLGFFSGCSSCTVFVLGIPCFVCCNWFFGVLSFSCSGLVVSTCQVIG